MADVATDILDHIVHLAPVGALDKAVDEFRKIGFKVLLGGVHAGGLTANALVVFSDGVYFEIISFTNPASHYPPDSPERRKRANSRWANEAPGWVDYAFLGNGSLGKRISTVINDRAEKEGTSHVQYLGEERGGRTRPDGIKLEWLITVPKDTESQGSLPFFCGDITQRDMRVPDKPPSNTQHPSGAAGIAFVRILSNLSSLQALAKQLTTVIGKEPHKSESSVLKTNYVWELQSPGNGTRKILELMLSEPSGAAEMEFTERKKTAGVYEVGIWVENGSSGTVDMPYGKITWVPVR